MVMECVTILTNVKTLRPVISMQILRKIVVSMQMKTVFVMIMRLMVVKMPQHVITMPVLHENPQGLVFMLRGVSRVQERLMERELSSMMMTTLMAFATMLTIVQTRVHVTMWLLLQIVTEL